MGISTGWALALGMISSACSYKPLPQLDDSGTGGIDAPGDSGAPDGSADSGDSGASADAAVCFGTGIVQVCLQSPPSAPLTISSFRLVNTDEATMCEPLASSNGNYCVVAATTITVDSQLRATRNRQEAARAGRERSDRHARGWGDRRR